MARAHGIDISYSQEQFDYSVNPDDIQFVIIRASNGTTLKDYKFDTFVAATAEVPIRGAYHYFRSEESPAKSWYHLKAEDHVWFPWKEQADHFLNCIADYEFDFYALDIEVNDLWVGRRDEPPGNEVPKADNIDNDRFHENAQKWMEDVAKRSGKPMVVYTGAKWYREWMNTWPLWIAQWSGEGRDAEPNLSIAGAKDWKFWQYAVEEKGKEYGVTSKAGKKLDLDVFNGTLKDLRHWLNIADEPEQPPKEPPSKVTPEPQPKKPKSKEERVITWMDVVVATTAVAEKHHEPATTWFREAGVLDKADDSSFWKKPYDGKPVEEWPISYGQRQEQIRAQILEHLEQK